ncbi:hypothetical protein [Kribbella sp. NPDC048928]|uniref:hypothetical protein n=1 Tax=Kribbella sp. NPDC048928 TaxID=3364111 RepID=UPI0037224204
MKRKIMALAGGAALAISALAPATAGAAGTAGVAKPPKPTVRAGTTAACEMPLGSVDANGAHVSTGITANTPPTATNPFKTTGVYAPGAVRLSSRFSSVPNIAGADEYGTVVIGDSLYWSSYAIDGTGQIDPTYPHSLTRIGGGWTPFTFLEVSGFSTVSEPTVGRTTAYALRNDGVLYRWNVGKTWSSTGSYPGFSAVKTMALIAKTKTYDTFLATTKGGALYTIHIPTTSPMKPVVKQVRSRTWQGFESLVASRCGQYGTLLLGIDKDTKTSYLYAVGHANGAATVINGLGAVPGTRADNVYFPWVPIDFYDELYGE